MSTHANMSGTDLHEDKRIKQDARAASTANVSLSAPGSTLDGVTLVAGDRVLLKDQTTASQNGIYTWSSATAALVRASDASTAALLFYGFKLFVREGTANAATYWTFTQTATVTLETTSLTFAKDGAGSGTVTSVAVTVPSDLSVSGSPVTTSGTIAISANTQSANTIKAGPASGAAAAPTYRALVSGDLPSAPTVSGEITASDFKPSGLTGATAASRYVGATASGAPASGTFAVGDYVIDQTGKIWICTTAGTPGTWSQVSGTGGGGGTGGSGVASMVQLAADVTVTPVNTYVDGPSVTVGPGTWKLSGTVSMLVSTSTAPAITVKLWDGTNVVATTQVNINTTTTTTTTLSLSGVVAPTSTTTYKISVAASVVSTVTIKAATSNNPGGNTATTITAEPVFGYSQSATAAAVATSGTITTSGVTSARVSPTGAVTGVILQAGTYAGQRVNVINEAVAANSVTFAASGTSNVADGTSDVIAGLSARLFVWDTGTSLWYRCA